MVTQSHIEGGWNELKGKVKEAWGQVSGDELKEFEGDFQQLVGIIQRSTGEARAKIESKLTEMDASFQPMLQQMAGTAREYYDGAVDATAQAGERIRQEFSARQEQAEEMVRARPVQTIAVGLGAGLLAGLVIGLLSGRSR